MTGREDTAGGPVMAAVRADNPVTVPDKPDKGHLEHGDTIYIDQEGEVHQQG